MVSKIVLVKLLTKSSVSFNWDIKHKHLTFAKLSNK